MALTEQFTKASASGVATCVEARVDPATGTVEVRHSRNPEGAVLAYTPAEWDAFLTGVRAGEFDLG